MLTARLLATPTIPVALSFVLLAAHRQDGADGADSMDDEARARAEVAAIAEEVAERRGFEWTSSVAVDVLATDAFRDALRAQLLELHPEGHFDDTARAYRLLGILPASFRGDLLEAFLEAQASNFFGLYSPTRDRILIPDAFEHPMYSAEGSDALRREILAHELQHARQDHRWSLETLIGRGAANQDQRLAASALAEGDAVCTALDWTLSQLGASLDDVDEGLEERIRDQIELGSVLGSIGDGVLADPTFNTFNYATGAAFVKRLYDADGWQAVDAGFTDLPLSTEQVLHPIKYVERRDWPVGFDIEVEPALESAGWSLVASDTLGELVLRELFAQHLEPAEVVRASIGWDGDQWLLLENGDESALVWTSAWDSRSDAREAYDALTRVFGLEQDVDSAFALDLQRRVGATRLVLEGERVALAVGFDREFAHRHLVDGGLGWFSAINAVEAPLVHHAADVHEGRHDARTTRQAQRQALAALEAQRVVVDGRDVHLRDLDLSFVLPTDQWTVETETPMAAVRVLCLRGARTVNFNVSVAPSEGLDAQATLEASLAFMRNAFADVQVEVEEVLDDPRGEALELRYSADLGGTRAWFRQIGILRGDTYVFLTCTSVGAAFDDDVESEFARLLDSATFGDEPR